MRVRTLTCATVVAVLALALTTRTTTAVGRPGVTPIPCPTQEWQAGDPTFEALPGAKAYFGKYEGGIEHQIKEGYAWAASSSRH